MGQDGEHSSGGYVYILVNPAYPRLLKVGRTTKDPEARARELSSGTGVPAPFRVEWSAYVSDCHEAERRIHQRLDDARARRDREFFEIPLREAVSIASSVAAGFSYGHTGQVLDLRLPFALAASVIFVGLLWLIIPAQCRTEGPSRDSGQPPLPRQWQLDPTPLLVGQETAVVLRNGSTHTGVLSSLAADHVSLTLGAETHSYKAQEIAQVVQRGGAVLEDAELQACRARIGVTYTGLRPPRQDQRLLSVTVTNNSPYDFRGRIRLTSFAADGAETANEELDLTDGPLLRTGQSATHEVVFHTPRRIAEVTGSVDGVFFRRDVVVKPESVTVQPAPASP